MVTQRTHHTNPSLPTPGALTQGKETSAPGSQLAAYRACKRIVVVDNGDALRCGNDGLRVFAIKGAGRYRHDPGAIVRLLDEEYGGQWPSQQAFTDAAEAEVARDIVRHEVVSIPWGRHVVDVELSE